MRIDAVNKVMRETSFSATRTTTAFAEATQKMSWDPKQGFRMEVGGTPQTEEGQHVLQGRDELHQHTPFRRDAGAEGLAEDVYFVSPQSPYYLLKQEASRGGRVSRTTYTEFGAEMAISMPPE